MVGVRMHSSLNSGREGLLGAVSRVIKKKKVYSYKGSWLQDAEFSQRFGIDLTGTFSSKTPNSG